MNKKVILINDTHFGHKNDNPVILEYFISFFERQLFPYIRKNDIKYIIHCGDLFDRRKYVNFKTLREVNKRVFQPLLDMNIKCYIIPGNHDTYFRNNNELNAPEDLLANFENWTVYKKPQDVVIGDKTVAFLPWMATECELESFAFVENSQAEILFGHLELAGFQSLRGIFIEEGYNTSWLEKFKHVYSGHYHLKSDKDNIHYLGTQYQFSYSDVWDKKGFHVLDLETLDLEFIENEHKKFFTLDYTDEDPPKILTEYKDSFVKIFVKSKKDAAKFEKFIDKFYELGVAELVMTDCTVTTEENSDVANITKDTLELLRDEVQFAPELLDKGRLCAIIDQVYHQTISEESVD